MNLDTLNLEVLRPILPLPLAAKFGILAGTVVLIIVIYYFAILGDTLDQIAAAEQKIASQKQAIVTKSIKVKKLPKLRKELKNLEKQLKVSLSLLPEKAKIPELLEEISWRGKDAGLDLLTFKPQPETVKAIYAEIPVSIKLKGTFRELLSFLRAVGELPRIVAINGLRITAGNQPGSLNVTGRMTTYRFVEKGSNKASAGRRGGRR